MFLSECVSGSKYTLMAGIRLGGTSVAGITSSGTDVSYESERKDRDSAYVYFHHE